MVERAYSIEFTRELDAKKANQYSITGSLKSAKAFKCIDENCEISLTCTNWQKRDGKRYYFRPSHNDEPHVEGCRYVTPTEIREHIDKEVSEAKTTISQSGIISVKKSLPKVKKASVLGNLESNDKQVRGKVTNRSGSSNQLQDRQLSSLATFIELFYDEEIENDLQMLRIDGEIISLNDYFIDVTHDNLVKDRHRVFFGEASVSSFQAKDGKSLLIKIEFIDSKYPNVYSNLKQIQERANTKSIADLVDTKNTACIYFRGQLNSQTNKFESFNDKFYKDLFLSDR